MWYSVALISTSFAPRLNLFKTMKLIPFVGILFLVSTAFGLSLIQFEDSSAIGDVHIRDWVERATVTCGSRAYGQSDDYNDDYFRSVHNDTSDDAVHAKSLLDKIIGGTEAKHGEIPWQASVKNLDYSGRLKHHCGAAVISEFWLLSAAHCFYGRLRWQWRVTVGEHHLYREDPGQQVYEVEQIYKHEKYNPYTKEYDIALIRIKPSRNTHGIQFNNFVQPICLPDASLNVGTKLLVSGWGWTKPCIKCKEEPQVISDILNKADIPLIDQRQCKRYYPRRITDDMFCAGYPNLPIDACSGDSGGPVAYESEGRYVVYGIVSWGGGCAQPNKPGVYARVTAALPWIERTMQLNSGNYLQRIIPRKPE